MFRGLLRPVQGQEPSPLWDHGKGTEAGGGLVGLNKNPVELEHNGLGSGMRVGGDEAGNAWDESMKYL